MDLSLGYDFTGKHLLLGADAEFPFKENLKLVSDLNLISATTAEQKYLDYLCGMEIGIGYDHAILAGAQGLYEFGTPEPELFTNLMAVPRALPLSYNKIVRHYAYVLSPKNGKMSKCSALRGTRIILNGILV